MPKVNPARAAIALSASICASASASQVVFLDFATTGGGILAADIHTYTDPQKTAIKSYLESLYAPYGLTFTLTTPPPFTASTIKFNYGSLGGGFADQIDFRNLDKTDNAYVNAVGGLKLFVGLQNPFAAPGVLWTEDSILTPAFITFASANFAAHELGHILGLRHHDSFGPIGTGIAISPANFTPSFPGPVDAPSTSHHVMALSSSVALNSETLLTAKWLSQRSAIKLEFNRSGVTVPEGPGFHGSLATAQEVALLPLTIANPLRPPEGELMTPPTFTAYAAAVTGSLSLTDTGAPEGDYYKIWVPGGTFLTIEVISAAMGPDLGGRIADPANTFLALLDDAGVVLPYYSSFAINVSGFETTDSILFDVFIGASGFYYIEVGLGFIAGPPDPGSYELFIYATRPIPAPGAAALLLAAGVGAIARRRRRREV